MATEKQLQREAKIGAVDLTGKEGYLATVNTSNQLVLADGTDPLSVWVIVEGKPAGKYSTIAKVGTEKVLAGGVIAAGASFKSSAAGKAVATTAGDKAVGRNGEVATADGVIFAAELGEHTAV